MNDDKNGMQTFLFGTSNWMCDFSHEAAITGKLIFLSE